ncbi:hypothetical protein [Bacillus safensis]|nr:hypothetical protein [Bacillus safensis]
MASKLDRATKDHYTLAEVERTLKNRELSYSYAEQGDWILFTSS